MFLQAAAIWAALVGFYLLLAGAVSGVEIAAGIVSAAVGTSLALGVSRITKRRVAGEPPARALSGPLLQLFPESIAVGRELLAAIISGADQRGAFVRQPFDPGSEDDPKTASRRALVVLGVSLAPRTFVIRGESSDVMLLHALPPKAASQDRRWPT